jgi:four helix bundle protein
MPDNNRIVYDKAKIFAIQIVEVGKNLINKEREYVISKQMLRSGTSIGANIAEANGAISRA